MAFNTSLSLPEAWNRAISPLFSSFFHFISSSPFGVDSRDLNSSLEALFRERDARFSFPFSFSVSCFCPTFFYPSPFLSFKRFSLGKARSVFYFWRSRQRIFPGRPFQPPPKYIAEATPRNSMPLFFEDSKRRKISCLALFLPLPLLTTIPFP